MHMIALTVHLHQFRFEVGQTIIQIMHRRQAFKYELMPTGEQQRMMRRFSGACRFVFNKALALQKTRFDQGEKKLAYADLCKLLTEWKYQKDTAWLCETPSQPLQQKLRACL